ncbi:MAG: hypothetical protein C0600_14230 [Ignavibacteria bacterium]|nr:MAG: hypothetical protein C0600_14230 [Ignavibacteria bacterium]
MDSVRVWPRKTAERFSHAAVHAVAGNLRSVTSRSTDKSRSNGLSKLQILRGYRAFGRVLSRGRFVQSGYIRCYYELHREIPPYQCTVGFAVRKAPSAVFRNRARRLMRECYRERRHTLTSICEERAFSLSLVFLLDSRRVRERLDFDAADASMKSLITDLQNILAQQ